MNTKKGMLFDSVLCAGCGACYEACKTENDLGELPEDYFKQRLSDKNFSVIEDYDGMYARKMCMHCVEPTCVSVCPVFALEKTDIGAVVYDADKCMGCRYCMQACPHNIPRYEWGSNNPRVRKCTMCYENRTSKGLPTACSEACPAEATIYGDLDELKVIARKRIEADPDSYYPEIYGLTEAGGTQVLVLASVPFEQLGFTPNLPKEGLPKLTKEALDKIPGVVAFGGLFLGGMYWLTKRKNEIAKEKLVKEQDNND